MHHLSVLGVALLFAAPALLFGGTAAAEPSAFATPAEASPGETVRVVFVVTSEAAAEASVLEDVSCTVRGPEEESTSCAVLSTLADVSVQGAQRSYAFELSAPAAPGVYVVTLTRTSAVTLTLPPSEATVAEATFEVIEATAEPAGVSDDPRPTFGSDAASAGGSDPIGGGDPVRWLASLWMAAIATLGSIVLARRGAGS